ncbi:hypothetical protein BS50DRAFT_521432, partial [Corynespora cassiicola Philippines]
MDIPTERPANADETLTESELAVTSTAIVVVVFSVILRFLGRWVLQKRVDSGKANGAQVLGMDDIFHILAVLTFFGLCIAVYIAIGRGMGTHVQLILYERGIQGVVDYNKSIYFCAIFYNTTLGMVKLSVISLYHRVLRGIQSRNLPIVLWVVFGIVSANTIANVLVAIFQCSPIAAAWDVTIAVDAKRCVDINAFYLGNAITGLTTDLIVYLLSIPIVMPLQMETKVKLQLLATMLVGGFAVITSAVRLGFIPALLVDPDVSMAMGVPMNWSVAEPAVGILVSSMPAIRAIRFLWRKPGEGSYGSYGSGAVGSALRSKNGGHVQLYDIDTSKKTDIESSRDKDNDSEENLVINNFGRKDPQDITRTTELELSYTVK